MQLLCSLFTILSGRNLVATLVIAQILWCVCTYAVNALYLYLSLSSCVVVLICVFLSPILLFLRHDAVDGFHFFSCTFFKYKFTHFPMQKYVMHILYAHGQHSDKLHYGRMCRLFYFLGPHDDTTISIF